MIIGITKQRQVNRISSLTKTELKNERKKTIERLDKLVSKVVIQRDGACVTCGSTRNLTNGHYVMRGIYALRWDLRNCNAQCIYCNSRHEYNSTPYTNFILLKYGKNILDEFNDIRIQHTKFTTSMLKDILREIQSNLQTQES